MNFIPKISHAQNLIHGDIKIKLLSDDDKNKNYKYIEDFYQNQNHFANQQQTVFSVFKSDNSEMFAGLICAFRRNSRDYFGNSCIVQIKLQNIEENITSVLEIIKKHFYNIFKVGTIFITFQNIDEYETFDLDNRHGCHDGGMPNKHHNHD
jgi:virulence-associated protein VapD